MSFETQVRMNSCSRASLRYALSLFGIGHRRGEEISEDLMKPLFSGYSLPYDEFALLSAAKKAGLAGKFHNFTKKDSDSYMERLRECLANNHACIITWHDDDENHFHWVCVAGKPSVDRFIVYDPSMMDYFYNDLSAKSYDPVDTDDPDYDYVPATMSASRLKEWITPAVEVDEEGDDYHFILELWPASYETYIPGMIDFELITEMKRDPEIYMFFDEYIDDLKSIFGNPLAIKDGEPAYKFFAKNKINYENMINHWTLSDDCPPSFYCRELRSLMEITRCYEFKVQRGKEEEVIKNLSFYLGWRACEYSYEVGRYC
jgi:hypothetical protein